MENFFAIFVWVITFFFSICLVFVAPSSVICTEFTGQAIVCLMNRRYVMFLSRIHLLMEDPLLLVKKSSCFQLVSENLYKEVDNRDPKFCASNIRFQ